MKTLTGCALVALVALTPRPASAQAGDGAFRLGADFEVIDLEVFPDLVTLFGFGVNGVAFGPSLGYQIGDSIVVGSRLAVRVNVSEVSGGAGTTVDGTIAVVPYFEYMFPDPSVAPFLGAQAGVVGFFADGADPLANAVAGGFGACTSSSPTASASARGASSTSCTWAGTRTGRASRWSRSSASRAGWVERAQSSNSRFWALWTFVGRYGLTCGRIGRMLGGRTVDSGGS